jgi:hypothetical protein
LISEYICLASNYSWMQISCSMTAHEHSSSIRVVAVFKMVLKRVKAILVWSVRLGSILGCLVSGTIIKEKVF